MKQRKKLHVAVAAALALALAGGATTVLAQPQHHHEKKSASADKKPALYPNTTREEPKLDLSKQSVVDDLNKGLDALNNGDSKTARSLLQPIADKSDSKYAQGLALQGLASADYAEDNLKGAIDLQKKAIATGVLPNDTYFQMMYMLAQYYSADDQYQPALDTLHQWRAEGKRETADSWGLEGILDYRMEKYAEAITAINKAKALTDEPKEAWNQVLAASYAETGQSDMALKAAREQLAKDPNDATTLHNATTLMIQAEKYPEALQLLEKARANGTLTSDKDYLNIAKLYMIIGQQSDDPAKTDAGKPLAVIKEGFAKGIIKPSYDAYKLEGQAAQYAGDNAAAVAAYQQASPLASDGQADLYLAQLLNEKHKYSAGRLAAKKAIDRGVKHMGSAYMLLAQAEKALNNKEAAIAAMRKAAEYPETKSRATAWLKSAGK